MSNHSLEDENKALRTKVEVLERELKIRSAECVKLREAAQELEQVKRKNESQKDVILGLRDELQFARTAQASAVEALEKMKKDIRDREHYERVENIKSRLGPKNESNSQLAQQNHQQQVTLPKKVGTSGGVVPTSSGMQVIYNSSDISSLGFNKVQRPVDFLGGIQNQQRLLAYQNRKVNENNNNNNDIVVAGEESEVAQLMEMAKEEALLDIKYAEVEDYDERELRQRLEALRRR